MDSSDDKIVILDALLRRGNRRIRRRILEQMREESQRIERLPPRMALESGSEYVFGILNNPNKEPLFEMCRMYK